MENSLATTGGWKNQLVKSESKFLAISGNEKITKKELGFAAQIFESNPKLRECSPESIMNAIINVARTGITLNPVMKLAYLIPRGGKCVLDFSYIGLIKMLKDYKIVKYIDAFIVYQDEIDAGKFKEDNLNNTITHEPIRVNSLEEQTKRKKYGAYTRSVLIDGTVVFGQLMPAWEIEKRHDKSTNKGEYSTWNTWAEDMWKKTAIRRDFKFLVAGSPSEQLQEVLKIEDENNPIPKENKATGSSIIFSDIEDAEIVEDNKIAPTPAPKEEPKSEPEAKPEAEKEAKKGKMTGNKLF